MESSNSTQLVSIDPRTLLVDVNIRKDVRLDKDFVASIKELGVLVPITAVRTSSGDLRVRFGHRRTLAAIEAGLDAVPVDVIGNEGEDDAAAIERIITQHAENVHRAGLTSAEKVEVVAQLSAFGVKASEITKKTRIPKAEVKAAKAVSKSELAKEASDRYDFLTLEQAAAVAEFEGDRETVKALVGAAQQGRFDHALEVFREDREEAKARKRFEVDLTKQGVRVIDDDTYLDRTVVPLVTLRRHDPSLTDKGHESCAGHAVNVTVYRNDDDTDEGEWVFEVEYVCTDPVEYGHVEASGTATKANVLRDTAEQDRKDEEARQERQLVIANNKAWRAAEKVRHEWLTTLLARKSAPKGAMRFVLTEMVKHDSHLSYDMDRRHPTACVLLGVLPVPPRWERKTDSTGQTLADALAKASDARAEVIALGLVLGAYESTFGTNVDWRQPSERHAAYLSKLVEWGYELSEIEQSVMNTAAASSDEDEDR